MNIDTASIAEKVKVLFVILLIAILSLGFLVLPGKEIEISVDGEQTTVVSYSETLEDLILFEGIRFDEGAYISADLDSKIEGDELIIIKNPKNYNIIDAGKAKKVVSIEDTVKGVLEDLGINLGEKDFTYPDLNEKIEENSEIRIYRTTEEYSVEEFEIPFKEEVVESYDLLIGESQIQQEGQVGKRSVTRKKIFLNGILTNEGVVKDEVVVEPINKIIVKGMKEPNLVTTGKGDLSYSKSFTVEATAYDSSFRSTGKRPGDPYYGITATGTKARPGVAAVDPRVIPLGTKLYIESLDDTPDYGFATAEDVGGAIKGSRIDLYHEGYDACRQFGRRNVKVYILD